MTVSGGRMSDLDGVEAVSSVGSPDRSSLRHEGTETPRSEQIVDRIFCASVPLWFRLIVFVIV